MKTTGGASSLLNTSYNSEASTKSKKNDLPTAASINNEAASARSKALASSSQHAAAANNRARQSDLRRSLHSHQHHHFNDVQDLSTDDLYATEVWRNRYLILCKMKKGFMLKNSNHYY